MLTIEKQNGRHYVICACGVKNQVLSSIFGRCTNCQSALGFAIPFIQTGSSRLGVLGYYKYGCASYDVVDHGRATKDTYNKILKLQ